MAVQMAIRRGVQRPVSGVAVAFMRSSQLAALSPPRKLPGPVPREAPSVTCPDDRHHRGRGIC
jgi:hypothetical protein